MYDRSESIREPDEIILVRDSAGLYFLTINKSSVMTFAAFHFCQHHFDCMNSSWSGQCEEKENPRLRCQAEHQKCGVNEPSNWMSKHQYIYLLRTLETDSIYSPPPDRYLFVFVLFFVQIC